MYQFGMSAIDSLIGGKAAALGYGGSEVVERAAQAAYEVVMGSSAANQAMNDLAMKGASEDQI